MIKRILKSIFTIAIYGISCLQAQTSIDNEPANNSFPGDTVLLPVNNNGVITNSSDNDYFNIVTSKNGVLNISVTGTNSQMQSRIYVYNNIGNLEGYHTANFGGDDLSMEFLTQYAGLYYVRIQNVKSGNISSNYTLRIELDTSDVYEYNNTISSVNGSTAFQVSLDEKYPAKVKSKIQGYYYVSNGGNYNYDALTADQDVFKISTGANTGVLNLKINPVPVNLKMRIQVFKDDGVTQLGYSDASVNGDSLSFDLLTQYGGTYYVVVKNINGNKNGAGNSSNQEYTLNLSLDTSGGEYNDNVGAISSNAPISISRDETNPTRIIGKIKGYKYLNNGGFYNFPNLSADQDYYKVSTGAQKGVLVMNLKEVPLNLKFRIQVFKEDGTSVLGYNDAGFNGDLTSLELLTQYSGVYYIHISNINGSANGPLNTSPDRYVLEVLLDTSGQEFNDNVGALTGVAAIQASEDPGNPNLLKGKIRGYYYVNNGGKYNLSNLTVDEDIYKVTTGISKGVLIMKMSDVPQNLRFRVEAYASNGSTLLGYQDAGINGDSLRFELLTEYAGVYYLKISNINNKANGAGNTSSSPYTLEVYLDTLGREFNNNPAAINSMVPVMASLDETRPVRIIDKIRGYHYVNNGGNYSFSGLKADQDYFKVSTGQYKGVLILNLSQVPANLRLRMYVYKEDGITPVAYKDASFNGDTMRLELLTEYAGNYIVHLSNINGASNGSQNTSSVPYFLDISLDTLGNEYNDDITLLGNVVPAKVSLNENTPNVFYGKLRGYHYINNGGNYHFNSLSADEDLYKITTGRDSGVLIMKIGNVAKNLKYRIELLNEDGSISYGYRNANSNGDSLTFEVLLFNPGTYFIRVINVNGVGNTQGNTSSVPYKLSTYLESGYYEFNNSLSTATPLDANDTIYAKIRGHYRVNFGTFSGADFNNLEPDFDVYRINPGCHYFQSATISNAPLNMRIRISAYDTTGNFLLGTRNATTNGGKVVLLASDLTKTNIVRYLRVENINTGNSGNTDAGTYLLTTSIIDTLYHPLISPRTTNPCLDSVVTFTSNSASNNMWSTGEVSRSINVKALSNKFVTLQTEKTGCYSGMDTAYVILKNKPNPDFTYSVDQRTVNFFNLSPTATKFYWHFGNGKTISALANPTHTFTADGTYTVLYIATNNCGVDSVKKQITVPDIISSVRGHEAYRFEIIPNPNKGNFTLELANPLSVGSKLEIVDGIGKTVFELNLEKGIKTVDLQSELKSGFYYLRISSPDRSFVKKFSVLK
ncbi:MAG: T9SS type A sorting domain-containing protein [Flavobacteriales bacterium]|nr:T9SS type A sorting domain-containing protein [Flavobacteriales bacterium]